MATVPFHLLVIGKGCHNSWAALFSIRAVVGVGQDNVAVAASSIQIILQQCMQRIHAKDEPQPNCWMCLQNWYSDDMVILFQLTTTHLTALYPGQTGWASIRRNIHSLTPCLCGYYTASLINFIHFLWSTASACIFIGAGNLFLWPHSKFSLACF